MKTVLVTGAAGFVGSHVVRHIAINTVCKAVAMVRMNTAGNLNRLWTLPVSVVFHDLKSPINQYVAEEIGEVDYVLHLAANSHVDRSILNPLEFFQDNVIGTVNLLDFCRTLKNRPRIINFSTDEVYGPAPIAYDYEEIDRFRPSNPYAASKASQSMVGMAYHKTYGLDIINTYTMNIFGPGQNPEKLIPKAIRMAKERKPMPVFSEMKDGKMVSVGSRHWLYVDNVSSALMFLMEHGLSGENYNIVGTDELTNEEVVRKVNALIGLDPLIEYVDWHTSRPGHDLRYAISGEKMRALGWVPKIGFDDGLERTIAYERNSTVRR